MKTEEHVHELQTMAKNLNCSLLASNVLEDPEFLICSGSGTPGKHHYGPGGLVQHTWEVVLLVHQALGLRLERIDDHLDSETKRAIYQRAFLASLFHDHGKTRDYYNVKFDAVGNPVCKTPHAHRISHLIRSVIFWETCAMKAGYPQESIEQVTHAILSHRGPYEPRSPVTPHSIIAWTLHTCDLTSARSDECPHL